MPTEFCLLTPPGRGAVAVIGVRGECAEEIVRNFFRSGRGELASPEVVPPGRILFGRWNDARGEELVICRLGDDVVEINCHGGVAAPEAICADLRAVGCREAKTADWMSQQSAEDLIRAEAWQSLAMAKTEAAARILLDQWNGALARESAAIVGKIAAGQTRTAQDALSTLIRRGQLGLHLTEPWRVVLVGEPNVGKSSLINRLLGFERAIVHAEPGTTRDVVSSQTALDGWPVELADTAGQRSADDELEATGIERGRVAMANADLVVQVREACQVAQGPTQSEPFTKSPAGAKPTICIANKCDLLEEASLLPDLLLATSAATGHGLPELIDAIVTRLIPDPPAPGAAVPFTQRQIALLEDALGHVKANEPDEAVLALAHIARRDLPKLPPGIAGW